MISLVFTGLGCGDDDDPTGPGAGSSGDDIEITIGNNIGDESVNSDITGIYISPSSSSTWGDNQLNGIIEWGYSATGTYPQDTYDIRIFDEDGDTYTRMGIEVNGDGYTWNVTLEDLDL